MFGFSSGDLMTLDDERHLFVSVVSGCSGVPGGCRSHDAGCIPADFV